jgi:hypothetical protein
VPRYFFNVYDDVVAPDEEGMELPNLQAARLHAMAGARDLIVSQVKHGYMVRSHWIDVADDQGVVVLSITFGEAVEVRE